MAITAISNRLAHQNFSKSAQKQASKNNQGNNNGIPKAVKMAIPMIFAPAVAYVSTNDVQPINPETSSAVVSNVKNSDINNLINKGIYPGNTFVLTPEDFSTKKAENKSGAEFPVVGPPYYGYKGLEGSRLINDMGIVINNKKCCWRMLYEGDVGSNDNKVWAIYLVDTNEVVPDYIRNSSICWPPRIKEVLYHEKENVLEIITERRILEPKEGGGYRYCVLTESHINRGDSGGEELANFLTGESKFKNISGIKVSLAKTSEYRKPTKEVL